LSKKHHIMRILARKKTFFICSTFFLSAFYMNAQDKNSLLTQDPKFEQLLNDKRKINATLALNDRYKIQIFSGESEKAKTELGDFKKKFKSIDGTIVFNTPSYKVWVGNFKTRIEAERNFVLIQKKYKSALLIKPSK
jgi:hypothetical protein